MALHLFHLVILANLCSISLSDHPIYDTKSELDNHRAENISLETDQPSEPEDRTIITFSIIKWLLNVFKTMVKPARDIYLTLGPEISAMKCLSSGVWSRDWLENREESPRIENYYLDSGQEDSPVTRDPVLKRIPRFVNEVASVLKDGNYMGCILPYMKERVFKWLDS